MPSHELHSCAECAAVALRLAHGSLTGWGWRRMRESCLVPQWASRCTKVFLVVDGAMTTHTKEKRRVERAT